MALSLRSAVALFLLGLVNVSASVLYVSVNSTNPVPPFTDWTTAATNIQDAVDAANPNDLVLVSNGVYAAGGRQISTADVTNRLVITNSITVQSVSGPAVTLIQGYRVSVLTNLPNAVRCVLLASNAVLSGFTLTNGSAGTGNYDNGGGLSAYRSSAVLSNCVIVGNFAAGAGGGAFGGKLINCVLSGNLAEGGGAASSASLLNCQVISNTANWAGGMLNGTATNCLLAGNRATNYGGASGFAELVNCTVVSNSLDDGSSGNGGGSYYDTVLNCIIYGNTAPNGSNYYSSTISYSCSVPVPAGVGNIAGPPIFVAPGDFHQQSNSPCINAGDNADISVSTDLDGRPRLVGGTVDLGACEFQGTTRYVSLLSTNPIAPYSDWAYAATNIQAAVDAATNGDMVLVMDGVYQTGSAGVVIPPLPVGGGFVTESNRIVALKAVTIQSVNGADTTFIQGYQVPGTTFGTNAIRCAYLTNGASLSGFTLIGGATRTGGNGGGVFCFSNATVINCVVSNNTAGNSGGGAYGGVLSNCTLIQNFSTNGSGGGAAFGALSACTLIGNSASKGGGAAFGTLNNCLLFSNLAFTFGGGSYSNFLSSCIITSNSANAGGGVALSILDNCTLAGNSATNAGGGEWISTMNDCILTGNLASYGGGASGGTLNNCTIISNSASDAGGGVDLSPMYVNNCIVYYNTAPSLSNWYLGTLNYCCTTPLPGSGVGNFTNAPLFVNLAGGDFHLQTNSPCINSGNNTYVTVTNDLDGHSRIVGGSVDVGAYEFQHPTSVISYAWLQQYGLPTDGSADFIDSDGNGMNNWQKWIAGLNPTNAASILMMLAPSKTASGLTISWESVSSRAYYVQRATDLLAQAAFSSIQSNIQGQAGTTSVTDTNANGKGPYFYRVQVQQ